MTKRELQPVYCDKCDRFLAGVPWGTATFCPRCQRITLYEPGHIPTKGVKQACQCGQGDCKQPTCDCGLPIRTGRGK